MFVGWILNIRQSSVCVGAEVANELPPHTHYKEYFHPDYTLHPQLSRDARYENKNTKRTLDLVKQKIFEQLRYLNGAPSVEMAEIPPDIGGIQGNRPSPIPPVF